MNENRNQSNHEKLRGSRKVRRKDMDDTVRAVGLLRNRSRPSRRKSRWLCNGLPRNCRGGDGMSNQNQPLSLAGGGSLERQ
nr:MAG TPA: hypothetical protein [Caudoviricetes sp.]